MSENKDLAVISNQNNAPTVLMELPTTVTASEFQEILGQMARTTKLTKDDFKGGISIVSDYWSPESKGETIIGTFYGFKILDKKDENTGEMKKMPAAVVYGDCKKADGTTTQGSFLLGGIVSVDGFRNIPTKSVVHITYNGKKGRTKLVSVIVLPDFD